MNRSDEHSNHQSASANGTPYRSAEGTFEPVLKSVLEDPSLTNAEFRLLLYATTKPEGWKFYTSYLVKALSRSRYEVEKALAGLVKKGYAVAGRDRNEHGKITGGWYRFGMELVLKGTGDESAQVNTRGPESGPVELACKDSEFAQVSTSDPNFQAVEFRAHSEYSVESEYSQDQSESQRAKDSSPEPDDFPFGTNPRGKRVPILPPASKPRAAPERSVLSEDELRAAIFKRWPGDGQSGLRQAIFYACTDRAHGFRGESRSIVAPAVAEVAATYEEIRFPKGWLQHERAAVRQVIERLKAEQRALAQAREVQQREAREEAERRMLLETPAQRAAFEALLASIPADDEVTEEGNGVPFGILREEAGPDAGTGSGASGAQGSEAAVAP